MRRLRLERGLTQERLAEAANLSVSLVQQIERGTKDPRASTLLALASALQTSTDSLLVEAELRARPVGRPRNADMPSWNSRGPRTEQAQVGSMAVPDREHPGLADQVAEPSSGYSPKRSEPWARAAAKRAVQKEHRRLGKRLQRLRDARGLSQEAVAKRMGIHVEYLDRVEAGDADATLAIFVVLARAYDLKLRELFEE